MAEIDFKYLYVDNLHTIAQFLKQVFEKTIYLFSTNDYLPLNPKNQNGF
jgi:hypothetical protein